MLDNLTKKEKAIKMKELDKLRIAYSGVKEMRRTPDLIVVVDGHYEDLALTEAMTLGIPTISLLGSTGDIDRTTYFVPCNVNSIKSLAFMLGELTGSIKAKKTEDKKAAIGKTQVLASREKKEETTKKKEVPVEA